ncbi:MAG: hypothetical protein SNJ74_11510 [Fimbriimonadaceae bacterium]
MALRLLTILSLVLSVSMAMAQSWSQAYEQALVAARAGDWAQARESFRQAAAFRTDDVSGPTFLPGPATERRRWRDGAPYSPNFLAAYAGYRIATADNNSETRAAMFRAVAQELEVLLAKGQNSAEAFYFLISAYSNLADTAKRMDAEQRFAAAVGKLNWRVDTEVVSPEENAAIAQMVQAQTSVPGGPTVDPSTVAAPPPTVGGTVAPGPPVAPMAGPSFTGARVTPIATKFALLIGNSASRLGGPGVPFASDSVQVVREALLTHAGYAEQNIDVILNATAAEIAAGVRALAERVPEGATVFIFFSGNGVNVDGRDYLAGVDTELSTDTSSMFAKNDLFRPFVAKGSRIFSFFESHREIVAGRYFGMEVPLVGAISQAQATIPGDSVFSTLFGGREVGMYALALSTALRELRSNRIPISEFGWQLFYAIRRGGSGIMGGSSRQTPTLPVLTNMANDARF